MIKYEVMATGINDDFLILLNSFLCLMKSKLKNVCARISPAKNEKDKIAIVWMQILQVVQHCLKGTILLQLYILNLKHFYFKMILKKGSISTFRLIINTNFLMFCPKLLSFLSITKKKTSTIQQRFIYAKQSIKIS